MSRFIEDICAYIKEKGYNVISIAEIHRGGEPEGVMLQQANPCQDSYSVAKAFTVAAVGMMYDKGLLTPDSRVVDLLGEECPAGLAPQWQEVTVHHLLTHSAGLPGGCLDIDCLDASAFSDDYLFDLMHLPFEAAPGEKRMYSDGAFYLLARIVEHLTGENMGNYLWKNLFYPLGFREMAWSTCPRGHCMGATGLYIRSADMVKLGQIFLTGGTYGSRRFLSEEWVSMALSAPYEMSPEDIGRAYGKGGMHCQKLFVDPDACRAVAYHGFDNVDGGDLIRYTVNYGKSEAAGQ